MKTKTHLIIIILSLVIFAIWTIHLLVGTIYEFEYATYGALISIESSALTTIMTLITHIGSLVGLVVLVVLLLAIPKTRKRFGYPVAITAIVSALLNLLLKTIINRPRPDEALQLVSASGLAFPSGHSQSSMAIYLAILIYLFVATNKKKIRIPLTITCLALPIFIGLSRIYLGVHFTGDVLAGWALGVAIAFGVHIAYRDLTRSQVKPSLPK